jgi:hypothetical protein
MLEDDLITRNPLRLMGHASEELLAPGQFGAVLARAGVGKTALLVQMALNSLLQGKNVMHISLQDAVNKVSVWYKEVFSRISHQYNTLHADQLWESILPHRFIMTFQAEGFTVPRLDKRLTDLMEQGIFIPQMLLIDGLPFDGAVRGHLLELKALAETHGMHAWLAVRTHRHEEPGASGTPVQLAQVEDLFEIAIQLVPVGKQVRVRVMGGPSAASGHPDLVLDPETMLIKAEGESQTADVESGSKNRH